MDEQKGLAKDQSRGSVSVRLMYLLVGLFALVVICSMGYIFTTGSRMVAKHAPLVDAAMEIKLQVAQSHLWFEEMISGDKTVEIEQIWKLRDSTDWYAQAMLEGGENAAGAVIPLDDADLRSNIRLVQAKLAEFRDITRQRYETPKDSAIGSEIEQRYDAIFAEVMTVADHVETQLQQVLRAESRRFRVVQSILIIFCAALAILVAIVFNHFIRLHIKDVQEVRSANQQLRAAYQQLEASEQQLRAANQQLQSDEQQLRAAHQQLQASERQLHIRSKFLRNTIDSLSHPFYVIDANDYTIKLANSAAVDPQDLKEDVTCYELTHHSDRPCSGFNHPCTVDQIKATREPVILEHLHYDEDGNERIYEVHGSPIFDDEGNVHQIIEYYVNVTVRKQAEQALRQSEANYRAIFDTANDVIFVHDIETGAILDVNEKISEIFGYTQAQARNLNVGDLSSGKPPYTQQDALGWIKAAADGTPQVVQWHCRHKSGRLFWVEVSLKRARIGGISRLLAIVRDISKRVQTQQELQKEKDLAQKYLDVAGVMFVGIDTEGKVFLVNKRSCEVLGYEQDEIIGKNWFDNFLPERLKEEIKSVSTRLLAGEWEALEYYENPVLTSAGAERLIAWHNTTLRNEQGDIIGYISSGQDITERKQVEEQLRFMQFAIEHIADAAFWMGPDAQFTYVNEAACRSLGYTRQELLSMTVHDIDPDFGPEVWPDHWREVKERGSFTIESHHRTKDGRVFPVEIRVNFLAYAGNEYNCAFAHDITERKRAEEDRERLMQTLEARTKEMQGIVYTASHDLQTPLVTVRGFGGQLAGYCEQLIKLAKKKTTGKDVEHQIEALLKEDIPEALKFINAGADKMRLLLEGLMRLSRIGTAAMDIQPIDMNKLMKRVTQAMNYQIQDKGASVTIGKLPSCLGDNSQIDQVFSNLLDNALKYLKPRRKGKIDISGQVENDMSIYCVEDNGIGVAGEHQEQIFEIFYRLEPTGPAGEGLGLTIVRRILDRHNGRIWAESQLGKGSCFFISLPHAKLQQAPTRKRKQK
jgi:PAS domain S-box-containing protein